MRLEIDNITFGGFKPTNNVAPDLAAIMVDMFKEAKIHASVRHTDHKIYFNPADQEKGKLFLSTVENKVALKKDSARAKKIGRQHLNTNRLTKIQEEKMWKDCINGVLDSMGMFATIKLYEHYSEDKNSFTVLRENDIIKEWPLQEKAYPV